MDFHPACKDCVLNYKCLLQDNGDVEECDIVTDYEDETKKEIVK